MILSEVCDFIVDCPHTTAKDEGEGYPLIRTPNIGKGRLILEYVHRVSEDVYNNRNFRAIPQDDDLIFAREAPAGNVAIIKNGEKVCLGQRTVLIRPNKAYVNPDYLVYYLLSPQQQYKLLGSANGATVAHVNLPIIRGLDIYLPNINEQKRIADILSAYDDLIENNQKQIKLLEEAAQRLYKEWFVDLRFPGHENTPAIDDVPQGWQQKTVEECLDFHGNGGWGKETPKGKNIHLGKVIRGTDIYDIKNGRFEYVPTRYHSDNDIKSRILRKNDLVFELSNGNINNIGRCLLIDDLILKNCGKNTICASFCKLLRPLDELHTLILYLEIQDMQTSGRMLPFKKHGANGINNFDFDGFLNHTLLIPNNAELIKPIEKIVKKISIIQGEITLLTEARNRLLPKLMIGEIEV